MLTPSQSHKPPEELSAGKERNGQQAVEIKPFYKKPTIICHDAEVNKGYDHLAPALKRKQETL